MNNMTKEDKELLLQDLCARLSCGVKVYVGEDLAMTLKQIDYKCFCEAWENEDFKCHSRWMLPYLRPLSSMTEEEKKELQKITNNTFYASSNYISNSNTPLDGEWHASYNSFVTNAVCNKLISWLDKNHFDHRTDEEGKTLIEKGLAIAVTKENNPYE